MRRMQWRPQKMSEWTCRSCKARQLSTSKRLHNVPSPGVGPKPTQKSRLPSIPARTRFAPSPTGNLHLGSLRTALYNYLLAKRTGGQFLLRVEDTDRKRTIEGAEKRLQEDLIWTGLRWDEGPGVGGPYGPYRQSERTALYQSHIDRLLESRRAYRCFCTPDRLDALNRVRNEQGLLPGYDRRCADIPLDESHERAAKGEANVVRLKQPDLDAGDGPLFTDLVYGKIGKDQSRVKKNIVLKWGVFDDPILLKSDGHPTYHLANVVDDHLMKITHVIRGSEWISSTPMHLALYEAFEWEPPEFGHVPLLVDGRGQKLSKRKLDIDIARSRDEGVFPDSLVNFACLLGWSHTQKSDIMDLNDLCQVFDLKITKGNTTVAFEKLWFLQKAHAQRFAFEDGPRFRHTMVESTCKSVEETYPDTPIGASDSLTSYVASILRADAKAYTKAPDFIHRNAHFFTSAPLSPPPYSPVSASPSLPLSSLRTAASALSLVPSQHWTASTFKQSIADFAGPESVDPRTWNKELYHFLRWALAAGAPGPGVPETMEILGRDLCVTRFGEAIKTLYAQEQEAAVAKPDVQILRAGEN